MNRKDFIEKSLLSIGLFFTPSFLLKSSNIVFIGDSLTCYKNGWQDKVSKHMGYIPINLAKGGKQTSWMLSEIRNKLPHITSDYLFIYGGINDSFSGISPDRAFKNIQDIVNISNGFKIKPIVIIGYNPEKVNIRTQYSIELETKCRNNYINLQKKLKELKGCHIIQMEDMITRKDSDDGIHLKASGINKFTSWIIKNLPK